jgi:hypothetical protein
MFNFEKLDVWQKGIVFADSVYSLTRAFPADDFARFIEISTGSLFEVVSHSFIANKQSFLSQDGFQLIYRNAEELSRMLSGLPRSLFSN